jgi:chemotaxis signal transduction protein
MKNPAAQHNPVHALEVPTDTLPLLVPSACMAEVVQLARLARVPHAPPWVLGVLGWRLRPVPVVSYDLLAGGLGHPPGPRARVVVLYPLPGRESWEFVGILSNSEPQSRVIDASIGSVTVQDSYPGIAAALKLNERIVGIPDLAALARLFYPGV